MCQTANHRSPILCALPPYVLRSIAENGTAEERSAALHTIAKDNTFRSLRATVRAFPQAPVSFAVPSSAERTIYSAHKTQNLPGTLARREGDPPTGDKAVDEAYDGLGHTYDFYLDVFARSSIDDQGMALDASVHYDVGYDNAFWDGARMIFGDGDGTFFNRFTASLDVIGHELTHGVTQDEAQLVYHDQPGALNESISDVFGSLIKQYLKHQTADKADWLIGAELLTKKVHGVAIRSMKKPGSAFDDPVLGKDPQPADMAHFVRTFEDNGGVHINSGIPNRAFYLTATEIGGYAWEKAGHVWYATLLDPRLRPNTGFQRFANLTVQNAGKLFGAHGKEQLAVQKAWKTVGIKTILP